MKKLLYIALVALSLAGVAARGFGFRRGCGLVECQSLLVWQRLFWQYQLEYSGMELRPNL